MGGRVWSFGICGSRIHTWFKCAGVNVDGAEDLCDVPYAL